MDILRMVLLHDLNLMQFYSIGILVNVTEMMDSKNQVFLKIYRLI